MELWIRSQDKKKFVKPIYIEIEQTGKKNFLINAKIEQNYDTICLGLYTTEERALEVLDEIQDLMRSLTDSGLKIIQYEMPKE